MFGIGGLPAKSDHERGLGPKLTNSLGWSRCDAMLLYLSINSALLSITRAFLVIRRSRLPRGRDFTRHGECAINLKQRFYSGLALLSTFSLSHAKPDHHTRMSLTSAVDGLEEAWQLLRPCRFQVVI